MGCCAQPELPVSAFSRSDYVLPVSPARIIRSGAFCCFTTQRPQRSPTPFHDAKRGHSLGADAIVNTVLFHGKRAFL